MKTFKHNLQSKSEGRALFTQTDDLEIHRVAAKLEARADALCGVFRTQHPEDRSAISVKIRLLRQRAAVLRRWELKALLGKPLPMNWKSELAEAESLDE